MTKTQSLLFSLDSDVIHDFILDERKAYIALCSTEMLRLA